MIKKNTAFLVVDDFEPMRKVTSGQLRSMGADTIITANNGVEALRALRRQHVDIVLSDWIMPIMDGIGLLKEVRADAKLSHLPFIMITAEAERYRIEEAIAAGVSDLLVKPYTADRLANHIGKALATRSRPNFPGPTATTGKNAALMVTDNASRPTILVVDDMADNLLLHSHLFVEEYRIRIAHNGQKALAICQSNNPPDLMLLDIMMPGMDGFEVALRMREHPTSLEIPIIFVTTMADQQSYLKGLELGAVDFVTKPIDPNMLKMRVHNFMRYVKLHKQLQTNYDGMLELAHLREDVEHITRHDMKGPLAGVIGLIQALADDSSLNGRQVGQLRMAEETALQVLDMINLSTELFKIETGCFSLDAKPIDIGDILHRIVAIARTTFAAKHLGLIIEAEAPNGAKGVRAVGDAMLCYSLFHNLVRNACEAAPDRSRVTVTVKDDQLLRITIRNKGAVPAEIRTSFFGKFVTHGKHNGTGLGTYSAKVLAEAQNGAITLEVSDPTDETTIIVTLPRHIDEGDDHVEYSLRGALPSA